MLARTLLRRANLLRHVVRRPFSGTGAAKPVESAEGAPEGVIGRVTEAVTEKVEAVTEKVEAVAEPVLEPLRDIISLYSHALQHYPLRANAATAALLGAIGEHRATILRASTKRRTTVERTSAEHEQKIPSVDFFQTRTLHRFTFCDFPPKNISW